MVMLIEFIDVEFTVEASIHDQVDLIDLQEFKFFEQMADGFDIGYVAWKFPVVHR